MDSLKSGDIYSFSSISDSVALCTVSIPRYLEAYLPHIEIDSFHSGPGSDLMAYGQLREFYSESEIELCSEFKSMKRQAEWLCGRFAVKKLITKHAASDQQLKQIVVKRSAGGAPVWGDCPSLNISISHSGIFAAAALLITPGVGLGIDIESTSGRKPDLLKKIIMSADELRLNSEPSIRGLIELFTVKEAYLKYIRRGFAEGLKRVEYINGELRHNGKSVSGLNIVTFNFESEYIMSAVF